MRVFSSSQLISMNTHPPIADTITMVELMKVMPGARRALFMKYHIGGCQSCGFQDSETLAQVCERNDNLPMAEVIAHLEESASHDLAIQILPDEFKLKLDDSATMKLLDIRSREEFEAVRINGSELLTTDLQQDAFATWHHSQQVVIIDHKGDRSLDVAAFFIGHSLTETRALHGGIDAYAKDADTSLPRYNIELGDN